MPTHDDKKELSDMKTALELTKDWTPEFCKAVRNFVAQLSVAKTFFEGTGLLDPEWINDERVLLTPTYFFYKKSHTHVKLDNTTQEVLVKNHQIGFCVAPKN